MKVDRKDDDAFWPSYVDLITTLFVVVLVLFIFSYAAYSVERKELLIKAENYQRLKDIDAAIAQLANKDQFIYQKEFKRYVFKEQVQFKTGDFVIDQSKYGEFLMKSGRAIESLMQNLKNDPTKKGIRYMVIIEGMASRDNYADNFNLSYRRANALYTFWKNRGIVFDPDVCEIIVAGSGTEGVGRSEKDSENKRFLIQVIPKVAYEN